MDNVTQAIFLAFAMFALVIGLSFSIYLLNGMNSVATTLIRSNDKTNDYQSVSFNSKNVQSRGSLKEITDANQKAEVFRTRTVSKDVLISTLYRYSKENFYVEIRDYGGNVNQVFDMEIEGFISAGYLPITLDPNLYKDKDIREEKEAANKAFNMKIDSYNKAYGTATDQKYMYGAVWKSNQTDIKQRIDLYISSQKGYISNSLVDYSKEGFGLKNLLLNGGSDTFTEQFIQYTYDGSFYIDTFGDDVESLAVEGAKAQKKIIIIYTQNK